MLAHTARMSVRYISQYIKSKRIILTLEGIGVDATYIFDISKDEILLTERRSGVGVKLLLTLEDLETLEFPEELKVSNIVEFNGYKSHVSKISFEAQFYVALFRIMGGKVILKISNKEGVFTGRYMDRKLVILKQDESRIKVVVTDLFGIYRLEGDYSVLTLAPFHKTNTVESFIVEMQGVASKLGKQFEREDVESVSI
jgi:hypothetical protein